MSSRIQIRVDDFVLTLSSPQDFFILQSDYQKIIWEQINILVRNGYDYQSLLVMPTYLRLDFIKLLVNEHESMKKENVNQRSMNKK